jgi:hypothetical protein
MEQITGLTARRLLQLAKAGYFPAPDHGRYQLKATCGGVIRHMREMLAAASGPASDERANLIRARRELVEIQIQEKRRTLIPLADICERLGAMTFEIRGTLQRHLIDQLPAHNAGLDAAKQRENNRAALTEICQRFQNWAREYDATLAAAPADPKAPPQK